MCGGAYPGAPDAGGDTWISQSGLQGLPNGAKIKIWSKRRSSKRRWVKLTGAEECGESTRYLVEVLTDPVNSAQELAQ